MIPSLLEKITQARVLVVGDVMLDRYWYGGVERISPEAPVPVVAIQRVEERLGGAANVASNVAALEAKCTLVGVTGDDVDANQLQVLLDNQAIQHQLLRDKLINTTVKLRVISQHQQLIRIDFETPVSKDSRGQLRDQCLSLLKDNDVIIISDYGKGGLGDISQIIEMARKAGVPVAVDPKGSDYQRYRGADLITPNRKEFEQVAGHYTGNDELEAKAREMIEALDLGALLITRSDEGMSLISRDGSVLHMPAQAREVFDVTGAGDTVIATVATAYAAGGSSEDALHLANIAAGIVVGKLGSAMATPEEIKRELDREDN